MDEGGEIIIKSSRKSKVKGNDRLMTAWTRQHSVEQLTASSSHHYHHNYRVIMTISLLQYYHNYKIIIKYKHTFLKASSAIAS